MRDTWIVSHKRFVFMHANQNHTQTNNEGCVVSSVYDDGGNNNYNTKDHPSTKTETAVYVPNLLASTRQLELPVNAPAGPSPFLTASAATKPLRSREGLLNVPERDKTHQARKR